MVTKERKWIPKEMIVKILNGTEKAEEQVEKLKEEINNLPDPRQPKEIPPEGGIGIREASRKYNLVHTTISRWVKRGYVPIIKKTANWIYIDEKKLAELAFLYKSNGGKGKRISEDFND